MLILRRRVWFATMSLLLVVALLIATPFPVEQQLPSLLLDVVLPRCPEEVPLSIRFYQYRSYLYDYIL
tara:strand:+ start:5126 stop:5329 length:204 start_codon:yes stop_codon:yes gene_type:complete